MATSVLRLSLARRCLHVANTPAMFMSVPPPARTVVPYGSATDTLFRNTAPPSLVAFPTFNAEPQRAAWCSDAIEVKGRNSRKPKKANRGARPCSHVARRAKTRSRGKFRTSRK